MTNENNQRIVPASAEETPPETVAEDKYDWSFANWWMKLYLGGLIFSYLCIALLSWDWRLTEDARQDLLFMHSWVAPFAVGLFCAIKCAEYHAFGYTREKTWCFWGTVAFEFCWGTGCHFLQPYMGECTWFGNDIVWLGSAAAFLIGTLMIVGFLVKKIFY